MTPTERRPLEDRRPIREALDDTIVVEAAAGTGKTTELVARIVRLVETKRARIGEIVAVTFSEKAAGELKLRIREQLEQRRSRVDAASEEATRLTSAVHDFEEAHVSTIHGFCAELLRERPIEARVDPAFTVLTESQADQLFDEAFVGWLHEQLAAPGEGLRRALRRPPRWRPDEDDENGPIERLKRAARDLVEWRDHDAEWKRPAYDRERTIDALIEELKAFAADTGRPLKRGDNLHVDTAAARRASAEIERVRRIGSADYDGWEALLIALGSERSFCAPRKGAGASFAEGVTRQSILDRHAQLVDRLNRFAADADADVAALLREELRGCLARYERRKREAGALDFLDLLINARDLVRDWPDVRRRFQSRFRVLLVDEFQDTDPLQAQLLLLLASDAGDPSHVRPGALFIVGDPKQSIYRFRRADVGVYRRIAEGVTRAGARDVTLQTSYRSVPEIQRFVNAAFRDEMNGDAEALQAAYVDLRPSRVEHPSQPAVVALPIPRPYGRRQVTLEKLQESQPKVIAEFVRWLVSSECPWTVDAADPQDSRARVRRAIVASDVCLLFRRFLHFGDDVTRAYVSELEARGVPHLLVGGKTFHEREEVDTIRTALVAIEWPEDELSVFATLRGSLFAIGDEELLEYYGVAHAFHPYRIPGGLVDRLQPIVAALTTLRELHAARNHRPVAHTIGRLIEITRAHAGFILWKCGEQVLANVLHISDLARQYEAEGGLSFRGFVETLREAAGKTQTPEAPVLEEGSEGVRLMTVHKAKGLEFPVVVLADIGCRLSQRTPSRVIDAGRNLCAIQLAGMAPLDLLENSKRELRRDEAEGVRLAYVAATRARDVLVVPAVGDAPFDNGWIRPLNAALYPPVSQRQSPQPARGCPLFKGKDTVLERPDGQLPDESTVRPGAYTLGDPVSSEPYTVVWWDPRLLDALADDHRGLRRDDLISKDARPEDVAADRARYKAWRARKADIVERARKPSLAVVTATEWSRDAETALIGTVPIKVISADEVTIEDAGVAGARPSGRRFGVLVHALLAAVPLDAADTDVEELAGLHAKVLGAPDDEREEAGRVVIRVLRHPVVAGARAVALTVRREAPVSIVVDGTLIDGQVDLAFETAAGWTVVDFKTDAEIGAAEESYRRQVGLYAHAIAQVTGRPARGLLLRV
jgi:ATP-dependent exoDNAse (exonuclease V) beta subunit